MKEAKNVLWTGGWDSTFRIIQLYERDLTLQPLYVIDKGRPSTKKEIETIQLLSQQIPGIFKDSKGEILPLKLIKRETIRNDWFIKLIFKLIRWTHKDKIGKQYYWLACLSKEYEGLEQSFHKEDRDQLINLKELTEIKDETGGENWVVNPKKMDFLRRQLFKNTRFPLMYSSKIEMKTFAEKHGFIEILDNTWFCHRSGDKPCGECAPCKQYIIDGFGYRLE